jgi:hypothetical protein
MNLPPDEHFHLPEARDIDLRTRSAALPNVTEIGAMRPGPDASATDDFILASHPCLPTDAYDVGGRHPPEFWPVRIPSARCFDEAVRPLQFSGRVLLRS